LIDNTQSIINDKSHPQRTLNLSVNQLSEPVMTSRQIALKMKMKDSLNPFSGIYSKDDIKIPSQLEEVKEVQVQSMPFSIT